MFRSFTSYTCTHIWYIEVLPMSSLCTNIRHQPSRISGFPQFCEGFIFLDHDLKMMMKNLILVFRLTRAQCEHSTNLIESCSKSFGLVEFRVWDGLGSTFAHIPWERNWPRKRLHFKMAQFCWFPSSFSGVHPIIEVMRCGDTNR